MMEEALLVGASPAAALFAASPEDDSKAERGKGEGALLASIQQALRARRGREGFPNELPAAAEAAAEEVVKRALRQSTIKSKRRRDGRKPGQMRAMKAKADVLPVVHGSSMFTRGETQTLSTVTLGPALDDKPPEYMGQGFKSNTGLQGSLYLHYDFPPYAVNEIGKLGTNRRMVGHGNLAERALLPTIPDVQEFPYTMRVTSEVTMSNGSSSMATACSASLALMDAGVPVKEPVGGMSVGLMTLDAPATGKSIGEHVLLTDIVGTEDHYGDMDFKVAGTPSGVTAMQLDVKLEGGIPLSVLETALVKAEHGRKKVLMAMSKAIKCPAPELKPRAPRCEIVQFEPDRKKDIVGFQGQMLRKIEDTYGVHVDLSEEGQAVLFGENSENVTAAKREVQDLVQDLREGEVLTGKVVEVQHYGCEVELLRNQTGLLHVSHMTKSRPAPPAPELVEVGAMLKVRVTTVDR
ncbi:unnamed protein product [Discosporangium mesarthrocarpum]